MAISVINITINIAIANYRAAFNAWCININFVGKKYFYIREEYFKKLIIKM